jgi:SSS family solute:Na+ symporter
MPSALLASAGQHFTGIDWTIVVVYFAITTVVGAKLAGKQATIRDFFLGGRKLPWYAVSGSIIATEISAVTFVGVPFTVYSGNMTYLQLGLGAVLAKVIVGYVFAPAFYEREIYSPYDYVGERLGEGAKRVTTGLFVLGQLLAQGVRVYLTALVLEVVTDGKLNLTTSIWVIGTVAVGWTLLGGMATVIWTDVLLFVVFVVGAVVSVLYVGHLLPGGLPEVCREGLEAGKFRLLDLSGDPTLDFTLWAGLIGGTVFGLNAYGTDQLIAQRMFCCRNQRSARWAMVGSSAGLLVTAAIMLVGVGLYAYYGRFPMSAADAAIVADNGDRMFPVFIVRVLPVGLTGLLVAGIFAAAVSSLDSILAALSQTTMSAVYRPVRRWLAPASASNRADDESGRAELRASRVLVVIWGIALCGMAHVGEAASRHHPDVLRLALSMAGYTGGALLAAFMLAFLKVKVDDRGLLWSAPLSVLTVFAVAWHQPWSHWVCWIGAALVFVAWLACVVRSGRRGDVWRTVLVAVALVGVLWINYHGYWPGPPDAAGQATYKVVAWPWFVPIGFVVAFGFGYLLAGRRPVRAEPQPAA